MKRNLYYRTMYKRTNLIKEFILSLFLTVSSYPRMLLEVFVRKNFGERYFSFATAVTVATIVAILPVMFFGAKLTFGGSPKWSVFFADYTTWYVFDFAFTFVAFKRWIEIKRNPMVFDFKKFSLYSGDINPLFTQFNFFGNINPRKIETMLEPLIFFVAGLLLWMAGQPVGYLLLICSIFYSLSYFGAYYQGDHFVMDKIDEMICNEEMFGAFVEDKDASETRGVRFTGRKPADDKVRRKVVESFFEDQEPTLVAG
jgi:hypothetical protein